MQQKLIIILLAVNTLGLIYLWTENQQLKKEINPDLIITKGLVVVDDNGIERVIISGKLPDPPMRGYRMPRDRNDREGLAGILLLDSEGQERSGYVTDQYYGNVFLTLDSKDKQTVLFGSEPQGGAYLMLWEQSAENKKNQIMLGAYESGIYLDVEENGQKQKIKLTP